MTVSVSDYRHKPASWITKQYNKNKIGYQFRFLANQGQGQILPLQLGAKAFNDLPERIRKLKSLKAFNSAVKPRIFEPIVQFPAQTYEIQT